MKKISNYESVLTKEQKDDIRNDYISNKLSLKELGVKYGIKSKEFLRKLIGNDIRKTSEANIIAHKKFPERFKHSEETKQKMRDSRLKWMKLHPEKTAWRNKNMSYPEKCFLRILKEEGIDKKHLILREHSVFPFFVDFAFIHEMVAIEIDGSQHLEEHRKLKDIEKSNLLLSKGWKVIRFTAYEVIKNRDYVIEKLLEFLGESENVYEEVGILRFPKKYIKKERDEHGLTIKQKECSIRNRKCERPSKEELLELINLYSFTYIGKIYGVSDNAIRKWCKFYGLPKTKKELKNGKVSRFT